jgi:hypothetical protein
MDVDVYTIRRMNLERLLVAHHGSVSSFAEQSGESQVYLTQVLSDKTKRRMGQMVARRIELRCELPQGWMDMVNAPEEPLTARALDIAQKFDTLPEPIREKIAAEIDTLYRYNKRD